MKRWTPKKARKLRKWLAEGDKPITFCAEMDYTNRTITYASATLRQYRAMRRAGWKRPPTWMLGMSYHYSPGGTSTWFQAREKVF